MFRIRYDYGRITLEPSLLWNGALVLIISPLFLWDPMRIDAHCSLSLEWQDWDESTVHTESEC